MGKIEFGFCVPIFANPGMAFFRTPNYKRLDWKTIKETALLCDDIGFDSLFIADHVFLGRDGDIWECISTMSALAAITKNLDVIPIHLCNNFRIPSIVAKTFATISHIANGRVRMFYDYGWRKAEFDAYGISFGENDEERIAYMDEGIEIIKGMLEEKSFSFNGKYYTVENAINNPRPVKKIPIWMGEANNPAMITSIVKHADVFNSMPCSLQGFRDKKALIQAECERQGRDFSKMGLSLETQILIRNTDKEIDEVFNGFAALKKLNNSFDKDILDQLAATNPQMSGYDSKEDFKEEFLIGTPEVIKAKIDGFVAEGVDHFMLWFMDYPDKSGIELFANSVMAHYK